jgi:hypothetical protein
MVRSILLIFLTCLLACASAQAQDEGFGLGVILGEPTGISGKLWVEDNKAFDGAIAWSFEDETAVHLHTDLLFHSGNVVRVEMSKLLGYYGIGGRIKFEDNTKVGIRVPLGFNYIATKTPVDVFLEIVPLLDLAPGTKFNVNAAIGIRYFF